MRKLGLVGGLGPESTLAYYRDIVYGVQDRLGRRCFPTFAIESVDVYENLAILESGDLDAYTDWLMRAINNLIAAHAQVIAIAANTPHIVYDRIAKRCPVPVVSIVEAAAQKARAIGYERVALFGTAFTMRGTFFVEPFERMGIRVDLPSDDEMDYIQYKIFNELEQGVVLDETRDSLCRIANRMASAGSQALVLGCTELPMILDDKVSPLPCLDTARVHVERIVEEIVADE